MRSEIPPLGIEDSGELALEIFRQGNSDKPGDAVIAQLK